MIDSLLERYTRLSARSEFNPETYSREWNELAADFEADGRINMANSCLAKAIYYATPDKGYANKLMFSEVTRVKPHYKVNKDTHMLPCPECKTDTKHVKCDGGWMCACGTFVQGHEGL